MVVRRPLRPTVLVSLFPALHLVAGDRRAAYIFSRASMRHPIKGDCACVASDACLTWLGVCGAPEHRHGWLRRLRLSYSQLTKHLLTRVPAAVKARIR